MYTYVLKQIRTLKIVLILIHREGKFHRSGNDRAAVKITDFIKNAQ